MIHHTRSEIASNWTLWQEMVDPMGTMTRECFDAMPIPEKIRIQDECFGSEVLVDADCGDNN